MTVKTINWKDVLIVLLILGLTFGYFLDSHFLKANVQTIGFYDVMGLIYYAKMKLLIIGFSLIWFLTCKHWWRLSILVLIFIELLKLISVFNNKQTTFDEIEFSTSLPITLPIIILLFYLSKKLRQFNLSNQIRTDIDQEIDEIFFSLNLKNDNDIKSLNNQFKSIQENELIKNDPNLYLNSLIELRNEFYKIE
ncbi:hypothetical protein [Psychroserpens sp. MEBiC05023]